MFFSLLNKKVLLGLFLIFIQVFILLAFLKKASEFHIIPLILCCTPGIIGGLLIYSEKSKGRF